MRRGEGLGFAREAAIIVVTAAAAAFVSNAFARRERKLAWLGRPPVSEPVAPPASLQPLPAKGETPPAAPAPGPAASPRPSPAAPAPPARTDSKSAASAAPAAAASSDFSPHPDKPFVEITPEQAKALYDRGALFIDARRSAAYREGHVRGARSISVWESDADDKVKALLDSGRDTKAPIVAYCSGGDCEDSHQLAQKLWGVTFDDVYVYRDGFPDWQKRGWPVETGDEK
ncbi:MAG TPA: rhodanese-like domain-containing protein [Thermoanaerobaculia bacterium]|nr:rhodanese-like domain-containing protein [Thermoanaerobaculia bacterium]